jgi:hypothetical protein
LYGKFHNMTKQKAKRKEGVPGRHKLPKVDVVDLEGVQRLIDDGLNIELVDGPSIFPILQAPTPIQESESGMLVAAASCDNQVTMQKGLGAHTVGYGHSKSGLGVPFIPRTSGFCNVGLPIAGPLDPNANIEDMDTPLPLVASLPLVANNTVSEAAANAATNVNAVDVAPADGRGASRGARRGASRGASRASENKDDDLTIYELERLDTIAKNKAFLQSLEPKELVPVASAAKGKKGTPLEVAIPQVHHHHQHRHITTITNTTTTTTTTTTAAAAAAAAAPPPPFAAAVAVTAVFVAATAAVVALAVAAAAAVTAAAAAAAAATVAAAAATVVVVVAAAAAAVVAAIAATSAVSNTTNTAAATTTTAAAAATNRSATCSVAHAVVVIFNILCTAAGGVCRGINAPRPAHVHEYHLRAHCTPRREACPCEEQAVRESLLHRGQMGVVQWTRWLAHQERLRVGEI